MNSGRNLRLISFSVSFLPPPDGRAALLHRVNAEIIFCFVLCDITLRFTATPITSTSHSAYMNMFEQKCAKRAYESWTWTFTQTLSWSQVFVHCDSCWISLWVMDLMCQTWIQEQSTCWWFLATHLTLTLGRLRKTQRRAFHLHHYLTNNQHPYKASPASILAHQLSPSSAVVEDLLNKLLPACFKRPMKGNLALAPFHNLWGCCA